MKLVLDPEGLTERKLMTNYFETMKGQFFKILPMSENKEPTLKTHVLSFQKELLGFDSLVEGIDCDSRFVSLLAILQYIADNPTMSISDIRREVFRACTICDVLAKKYSINNTEVVR